MKRKVKFQEGGEVESPRNRQLRETMERFGREGRRVGLAERARQREAARRAAAAERAAAQRDVERLNPGQGAAEAERRAGRAVPERRPDFTTDPRGTTRRGAATGREVVPRSEAPPPRPSMQRAMTEVMTPRQMPLGRVRPPVAGNIATAAIGLAPLAYEGGRELFNRGREALAGRRARATPEMAMDPEGSEAAANQMRVAQEPAPSSDGPSAGSMQTAPRPRPRPRPAPRRELTMEEIRALRGGERAPRNSEERALIEGLRDLPTPRPATRLDENLLSEREAQRLRAARAAEEAAAQRANAMRESEDRIIGGSGNIGAASARERGEQVGPFGDYNLKKGGIVKKKAGGMIKAAPKKMIKGGVVAKPKSKPKAKPAGKPMPFKKGGVIKKGRK